MNIVKKLFSSSVAEPIEAIGNAFDKLFTSAEEKAAAKIVYEKLLQHPLELQVELNKIEAQHPSIFIAGWRPFIGWICGFSLACYFVPQYLLGAWLWVLSCINDGELLAYPVEPKGLIELICALLGMGVLRSVDKWMGRSK